jgi:hypothetical protein
MKTVDEHLTEPLLALPAVSAADKTAASLSGWLSAGSFVTGSVVALLSQYVLSQYFWQESILASASTWQVLRFSLYWSLATCFAVFMAMLLSVHLVQCCWYDRQSSQEWDQLVFRMEAHHIVGALLTISVSWIVLDLTRLQVSDSLWNAHSWPGHAGIWTLLGHVVVLAAAYAGRKSSRPSALSTIPDAPLLSTYQLLATTLGLVVGLCSQFFLSACLWREGSSSMAVVTPLHFLGLSLCWSCITVLITFGGCYSLQFLPIEYLTDDDQQAVVTAAQMARVQLRMESSYVLATLFGICMAWILVDVVLGLPQQIAPSLFMLALAICAFRLILHWFPEDDCIQEYVALAMIKSSSSEEEEAKTAMV